MPGAHKQNIYIRAGNGFCSAESVLPQISSSSVIVCTDIQYVICKDFLLLAGTSVCQICIQISLNTEGHPANKYSPRKGLIKGIFQDCN